MKLQHITNTLLAALLLCSCNEDVIVPDNTESGNNEKVRYTFNVDLGEEMGTRAMTENAQIKNMYVAVFDAAGYKLSEYAKAELTSPAYGTGTNETKYQYSVELTVSSSARILHFIANAPKKLTYGSESEVIGSLYTGLANDDVNEFQESYWQRIEMTKIPPKPVKPNESDYAGNTTAYNTALDEYEDGMEEYNNAAEELNDIKLIRNYSKITLTKKSSLSDDVFQIKGMWLINNPDRGTVAPYNRNTGEFMDDYLDYSTVGDLEDPTKGNYQGFMLATTQFILPEDATDFIETGTGKNMIDAVSGSATGYVYEREKALEHPMYLIIKALYNKTTTCYYKVALQDNQGNFYSMLRNFNYLIEVQDVKRKGEDSAIKALQGAPSGDISLNVEFNEITSISDGEATLSVSYTTLVLVGKAGEKKEVNDLWYKYEPVAGAAATNDIYSPTVNPGVEITYGEYGASGPVINESTISHATTDETGGIRYWTFETNAIEKVHKTQTITITGKHYESGTLKTITRKINLILREYLDMELSTGPNTDASGTGHVSKAQGEASTLTIGIEEGLPSSMFPLDFKIEAARRTLTPNGDAMPVENGTSTITDAAVKDASGAVCKGHPSYWFIKTISWEDYTTEPAKNGKKYFVAKFKNNITDGNTEHIYVSQDYFNQAHIDLEKYTAKTISSISLPSSTSVGSDVTLTFTLGSVPASGKITVGLAKLEESNATGYTKQLNYLRTEEIAGVTYDIFEMPVSSTANTLKLKAYEKGTGSVMIWADEHTTATKSITIN